MRKLLPIGLLTLCFAITSQERASAWINSRFGIGLNWSWQSGGNNLLWGLFRDGQPPAPCPVPPCGPMGPMGGAPMMPGPIGYPFPGPHGTANDFPFFGRTNTNSSNPYVAQPQTAQNAGTYHPVGYSPAAHSYYRPSYYPYYGYGNAYGYYPYRR
jgi:hypothetical protein